MKFLSSLMAQLRGTTAVAPFVPLTATVCGHTTRRKGKIRALGDWVITEMPLNEHGTVNYCLDCLGKMAISCAWCSKAIFVYDAVTLYSPRKPNFALPNGAVRYSEETGAVVGCLRWECADSGADRAGFWVPGFDGKGIVLRTLSPLEAAFRSGKPIVVSDVTNPHEALALTAAMAVQQKEQPLH